MIFKPENMIELTNSRYRELQTQLEEKIIDIFSSLELGSNNTYPGVITTENFISIISTELLKDEEFIEEFIKNTKSMFKKMFYMKNLFLKSINRINDNDKKEQLLETINKLTKTKIDWVDFFSDIIELSILRKNAISNS